ncbi:DUF1304 family protein [Demequina silvatica]|uniref:DUF1304 family protein n=1 Tax=Demequina silvatica TaxID=1638988 RepID=UPI000784AB07|nr:DUF1304 family protein [Demequina silvatica]
MSVLSQVFAGATALALIVVGLIEILRHGDQRFHRILLIALEDVPAVRMWAMNIGAYNITTAIGIVVGLCMVHLSGNVAGGTAIVIALCAAQVFLGFWLWVTERRLLTSAIGQALTPALAIAFALA